MKILTVFLPVFFALFVFFPQFAVAQKNKLPETKKNEIKTEEKSAIKTEEKSAANNLASTEQSVLDEINKARSDPQKYIDFLTEYKKVFKGNVAFLPNYLQIETREGTAPIDEAIAFLKTVPKLPAYKFSDGLNKAAKLQLADLMQDNSLGHTGKNGSDLTQRMNKFGNFGSVNAENISFYSEDPRYIVLMWIVDDGVKSRSHRRNIFSPNFKVVGIGFGKGKIGEGLCVLTLADSFTDYNGKPGVREF